MTDHDDSSTSDTAQSGSDLAGAGERSCINGHQMADGHKFCPLCGARPLRAEDSASVQLAATQSEPAARAALPGVPFHRRPKFLVPAGLAVLALAVVVVFVARGGKHDMTIRLSLHNPAGAYDYSRGCNVADSGYSDLSAGAAVTVKDKAGSVLASTFLPSGVDSGSDCKFTVHVSVPNSAFYQVEVSQRGNLTYTKDELEARDWEVDLTIGN